MTAADAFIVEKLRARRRRLASVGAEGGEDLVELLQRVDLVLANLEHSDWGECRVCDEAIDDPPSGVGDLVSICLKCLSDDERRGLEADLQKAAKVQQGLLPPRELTYHGWSIAWHWEPLGAVSGDHVDILMPNCEEEVLHLLLGDVVGKGVSASLLQSHLHALFRGLAVADLSLAELMRKANSVFYQATAPASYASLISTRLHRDGVLEMTNAGHPRPLLANHRGVRPVEGSGLPLGLFPESGYSPWDIHLEPGNTVLFYTDGLTEAENDHGEYGIGRAAASLRRAFRKPLREVVEECREDLLEFLGAHQRTDDLTLLAIRRVGTE